MNILLDECLDWRLRNDLPGHSVRTVQDMGWGGIKNGQIVADDTRLFSEGKKSDSSGSSCQNC